MIVTKTYIKPTYLNTYATVVIVVTVGRVVTVVTKQLFFNNFFFSTKNFYQQKFLSPKNLKYDKT